MIAITNSDIDPQGIGQWAVVAPWYGAERIVFRGDVFTCTRYVNQGGEK